MAMNKSLRSARSVIRNHRKFEPRRKDRQLRIAADFATLLPGRHERVPVTPEAEAPSRSLPSDAQLAMRAEVIERRRAIFRDAEVKVVTDHPVARTIRTDHDFDHDHVGLCRSSDVATAKHTLTERIDEKILDAAEREWLKRFDDAYPELMCDDGAMMFGGSGRNQIETIADQIQDEFRDLAELSAKTERDALRKSRRRHEVRLGLSHGRGHAKGMYRKKGKRDEVFRLLRAGKGVREVARITGAAKNTVAKARRILVAGGMVLNCECGQPSTHQGWCVVRFRNSAARQATLASMHAKQRKVR